MQRCIACFLCILMLLYCTGCSVQVSVKIEPTAEEPSVQTAETVPDHREKVTQILDENRDRLGKTAVPLSVYSDSVQNMNGSGNTRGLKDQSVAFPFLQLCGERKMNPIAAFRCLVRGDMFTRVPQEYDSFTVYSDPTSRPFEMNSLALRIGSDSYQFGLDQARLVEEWLELSRVNFDELELEDLFLDQISESGEPFVFYSDDDSCYYAYFIGYGDAVGHILCVYLRTNQAKAIDINDVEFQLLSMYYQEGGAAGSSMWAQQVEHSALFQAASLITALEQLMTGTSVFADLVPQQEGAFMVYNLPLEYTLEGHDITITQEYFESDVAGWNQSGSGIEQCTLTTYRIRNTKLPYAVDGE